MAGIEPRSLTPQGAGREFERLKSLDDLSKPATEGICPVCGTKMFRIGKSYPSGTLVK